MNCLHCDSPLTPGIVDLKGDYRGKEVTVRMNGLSCPSCGYATIRGRDLEEFRRLVKEEYRRQEGIVDPEEIRTIRRQMNATQEAFASFLNVGVASVKRLELGSVPEQLMDEHLRMRLFPETMESVIQDNFWTVHSLRGALAELPRIEAHCSFAWNELSSIWNTQSYITLNYDTLFEQGGAEKLRNLAELLAESETESKSQLSSAVVNSDLELAA